ncbi:flagellar export protein FliJ [Halomonas sp. MCCC 1A17488]|uniref:Flagellar FliJ protein n=1 Tax=Billgrantia sulfidoxydans TaxID=2733484 RepID=A0ABX7W682_9GAMM|nr:MULTISPECIES: flagellar export protein FliJ [Halomonas]MCE8014796.1 flagellar export protein FliJ [Halomonas sp. MCCC 1A17488]MCG3238129.1 flagellar export protein FliJ [Halomonas sp. MCCC 1A17488]QPP48102.1 flagellar export protein FliJ [Halomonas sp. SS10-MC5]QTP55391.1 flagellar export protein FliJ [Halomonas sulfidoxydans]
MSAPSQLAMLSDLARDARDQAGRLLAGERQSERQVASQLESLSRYRLEYAERLQQAMREGIDPASMHNYQQFLASLDAALQRARQALDAQQQRVQQSQQQWRQEQQRLSAFDTLVSRRDVERQRQEERREQRTSDEMAAGRLLRQRAGYAS